MINKLRTLYFLVAAVLAFPTYAVSTAITIERDISGDIYVLNSQVIQGDDGTFVQGRVKRRHHTSVIDSGFIEVTVTDDSGTTIMQKQAPYRPRIGRRNNHHATYQVMLPASIPEGSTVHVAFRRS